jgi:hypothetical protein
LDVPLSWYDRPKNFEDALAMIRPVMCIHQETYGPRAVVVVHRK